MAHEKRLHHPVFLGVDLVRAIEEILASQRFHRHPGREHAIGLARRLHARGDVDRIAPDVVGELARADDPAITGPEFRPTRIVNGTGSRARNRPVAATTSSANFAASRA